LTTGWRDNRKKLFQQIALKFVQILYDLYIRFPGSLHAQIIDSIMELSDELEEITEADFDIFNGENIVDKEMDTSQIYTLDITREADLESQIFNIERQQREAGEGDQTISQTTQAVVLAPQHDDFNIKELVRGIDEL
jgi:hypothetical protein